MINELCVYKLKIENKMVGLKPYKN